MLSQIRNIKFTGILWGVLAMYFLNISVDVSNSFANDVPENLSYNKQESIIEMLVEKVFGFENAIAEYDEQDTDQSLQFKKNVTIDAFILPGQPGSINHCFAFNETQKLFHYIQTIRPAYREIHSPPPDFIV